MILLDTNAVVWLNAGHRRARALLREPSLYVSPATLLELQFLQELGRIRLAGGSPAALVHDDRWSVDDPPASAWFLEAGDLAWTRDPFDRLIVAHARLRGWRLATGDAALLTHLGPREQLPI